MQIVGKDIPHDSAALHVSGRSMFLDDLAPQPGELLAGIVPSPVAHGRVKRLDVSAAAATPGVLSVLTYKDIPGHNAFGPAFQDELLLVQDEATFLGQPLAIIGAEDQATLDKARRAVVVEMEELSALLTVRDAIAANSYLGEPRLISRGDVDAVFANAPRTVAGSL